jgi:hypothetical protein
MSVRQLLFCHWAATGASGMLAGVLIVVVARYLFGLSAECLTVMLPIVGIPLGLLAYHLAQPATEVN